MSESKKREMPCNAWSEHRVAQLRISKSAFIK